MNTITSPLPVITNAIPDELKERRQWVAWKQVTRSGKPTKVPINPDMGSFAQTDAPSTWGTFEQARDRQRLDRLAGVGFVFSESCPYLGADFDKCRNPETGEIDPLVRGMIALLDSYAEVSPSGTGVKVIVRAAIPGTRNRTTQIEFYDRLRFFTLTGHRVPGMPAEINDRQSELDTLYRRVFGDMTDCVGIPTREPISECSTDGATIWQWASPQLTTHMARIAHGDDSQHKGDASRADEALLCALMGLGLTRAEARSAFLASPRGSYLEQRKLGRTDYLLERAVSAAAAFVGEAKVL